MDKCKIKYALCGTDSCERKIRVIQAHHCSVFVFVSIIPATAFYMGKLYVVSIFTGPEFSSKCRLC
jgi:hypothetical protein